MNRRTRLATLLLVPAAGALLLAFARPQPQVVSWQYRVERVAGLDISARAEEQEQQRQQIEARLNAIAAEGFELVQAVPGGAIFRRAR